jgi:hypothetical protein
MSKMNDKKISIFVATPMHAGTCTDKFSLSCISLQKQALLKNIEIDFVFLSGNAMITSARNSLVSLFLQSNYTHMLFIDSDISFDAHQVLNMALADKDVIGAVYPTKEIDWDKVYNAVSNGFKSNQLPLLASTYMFNPLFDESITLGSEKMVEVKHLGTGMLCIKREVFESMKDITYSYKTKEGFIEYEFFATNLREGITTEDFYFCESWRKTGGKIFLAPWVILRHTGNYTF